jgi:hypothetical protein
MGGLFRAPRPAVVEPQPPPSPAVPPPAPAPEQAAETARERTRQRSRQGIAGTIATSPRGLLEPAAPFLTQRRSLLGE